jgi:putative transposase
MNLCVNMLLEWQSDDETVHIDRVLWIDPSYTDVATIKILDPKALPFWQKARDLEEAIAAQKAISLEIDPYASLQKPENTILERHKERRDKAWDIIAPLVEDESQSILFSHCRGKLINARIEEVTCTKMTLYKYLRRYWQGGQTRNALLPSFNKCGAPGKQRRSSSKKRGRPSKLSKVMELPTGINVDDEVRRKFSRGIQQFYENSQGLTLKDAFQKTLEKYFHKGYEFSPDEVLVPCLPPAHELPTFGQFRYWYEKERNVTQALSSREGKRRFNLNRREVLGESTHMAFGPGSIYQIDATIGDVYLVSSLDRTQIIGRPVIYVLVDVFSRMVTGLSVSLEGPSWLGAMQALENAAIDKVEFCREYGVEIISDDWPCHHLPETIIADRGELEGYKADNLVKSLNITVSNTPPYRADWKGIVERNFRISNDKFIHWLPGAVYKPRERGEKDYRLDAVLDLHQFRKLMILSVLDHNKEHRMNWYPMDEFMIQAHVEPYPLDLWNWGIRNRAGHLRVKTQDILRLNLLPAGQASVTHRGIQFKGLFYSCDLAVREQWFVRARERGRWKVDIAYDPRNLTHIYLRPDGGQQMECCQLIDRESTFRGCDFYEVLNHFEIGQQKAALSTGRKQQAKATLNAQIEKIVDEAKEQTSKALEESTLQSKQARVTSIRNNRKEQRDLERKEQFWNLAEQPQTGINENKVVPLVVPDKLESEENKDERQHEHKQAIHSPSQASNENKDTTGKDAESQMIDRLRKLRAKTWNDDE